MTLIVQPATPGSRGVDTIAHITYEQAKALYAAGYRFAVRYLGHISPAEVIDITSGGLALLFVAGYSRRPGWVPTASMGAQDGCQVNAHLLELGATGTSIYVDFEGPAGDKAACLLYGNAAAHAIQHGGSPAGVYVGYGIPLDSVELYWSLAFTGYWKSLSNVPDIDIRGYQMIQHGPANQKVCGVQVDINTIQADRKGNVPQWLVST
jgi:Domain of unknown function (DUF1906)